ncbi:hypothetical protein QJS04_geneDACA012966 [Acorus gramineus]|uniref:CCHC-type domain-containing protein n=1 Tax=Acorus gramineus TaxID=55184 RepID=A0AAV9B2S0_ACOGR|nr:hypothetical protein QJS04_geneDACA012966 [Acorus gramineus]
MGQRGRWREKELESEDELDKSTVVMISSDDEGGANEDLTLAIVEKAKEREARRKRNVGDMDGTALVDLCSPSSAEEELTPETATETEEVDGGGPAAEMGVVPAEEPRKKRRRRKKKKEPEIVCTPLKEDDPVGSNDSVITVANEVTDNAVMRSLLRGPRYFDPGDAPFGTCYNCGEEGHTMAQCTVEKKKKPCYVCGKTGHEAKRCTQGKDCYICKKRGHQAKNCPEKYERIPQDSKICLQCGELGHEMFSCRNEYDPDDLKEIQCYVCDRFGHLCCVNNLDMGPYEISCYNCGQSGHSGLGCAKSRGETSGKTSGLCYKCGEGGHFARGCSKFSKWNQGLDEPYTPAQRSVKEGRRFREHKSAPQDHGRSHKKKFKPSEDGQFTNPGKPRKKHGWIVDDPGDYRDANANGWGSPSTSSKRGHHASNHHTNSQYSYKKHRPSHENHRPHHHEFTASRFGNKWDQY